MGRKTVAICHQTVTVGDAIGNDICGMYRLFEAIGFQPAILCEFCHEDIAALLRVIYLNGKENVNDFDLLVYHHSLSWERGEELFGEFRGEVIMKYHNITPSRFFEPYSPLYAKRSREGYDQISRFMRKKRAPLWLTDSEYNRMDLMKVGTPTGGVEVAPPFNRVDALLDKANSAEYGRSPVSYAVVVGRLAPNKGIHIALQILKTYLENYPEGLALRLLGPWDEEFHDYYDEIRSLVAELDLEENVLFYGKVSEERLFELMTSSHLYLSTSEHEGFCVPIIEAQALGTPLVASGSTAVPETAGEGQLVAPPPNQADDYLFFAGLIHELLTNDDLRKTVVQNGYRNVIHRFTQEKVENRFLEGIWPVLRRLA